MTVVKLPSFWKPTSAAILLLTLLPLKIFSSILPSRLEHLQDLQALASLSHIISICLQPLKRGTKLGHFSLNLSKKVSSFVYLRRSVISSSPLHQLNRVGNCRKGCCYLVHCLLLRRFQDYFIIPLGIYYFYFLKCFL